MNDDSIEFYGNELQPAPGTTKEESVSFTGEIHSESCEDQHLIPLLTRLFISPLFLNRHLRWIPKLKQCQLNVSRQRTVSPLRKTTKTMSLGRTTWQVRCVSDSIDSRCCIII